MDAIDPGRPADGASPPPPDAMDKDTGAEAARPLLNRAQSLVGMRTLAFGLVIVATSLYLLERLEPVLRPLLIAILLSYLFLPAYHRLRRHVRPILSFLIIAIGITLGLQFLARLVYRDVVLIDQNVPRYMTRERSWKTTCAALGADPALASKVPGRRPAADPGDTLSDELSQRIVRGAASTFLSVFLELFVVAFYMIFLLQSASRLPERIQSSFSPERAKAILESPSRSTGPFPST